MPGPVMMGPPKPPQLDEARKKIVDDYAEKVYEVLEGLPIGDINHVFMSVNELIMKKKV